MNVRKLTKYILLIILIGMVKISFAQESGKLGVGGILGNPTGPTVKYWLSEKTSLDLTIGLKKDISLNGNILFQYWDVFPQPQEGRVGGYLGVGAKYQQKKNDDLFGIRGVGGINYWASQYPIELFIELAPVLELTPNVDTDIDAGIGIRYYFN